MVEVQEWNTPTISHLTHPQIEQFTLQRLCCRVRGSLRFSRHSREIGHWVKILSRLNIPQVAELPGVGENYLGTYQSQSQGGRR